MPTEHATTQAGKCLIIVGAGGHARVVLDAARASGQWDTICVRDDNPARANRTLDGVPIECPALPDHLNTLAGGDGLLAIHLAIGDNQTRARLAHRAHRLGIALMPVCHPHATVAATAQLEPGCFVAARAVVGPGAWIGQGCIVNHGAIVDHDCYVDAWAHVAPGAILGGGARVGTLTLVGAGAVVLPLRTVGAQAIVGAGAVVIADVPDHTRALGVPARNPIL